MTQKGSEMNNDLSSMNVKILAKNNPARPGSRAFKAFTTLSKCRTAGEYNEGWARAFRVEPRHVVHFGLWGNPIGVSPQHVVKRW